MYKYKILVYYKNGTGSHTLCAHPVWITGSNPSEINRKVSPRIYDSSSKYIYLELEKSSSITVKMHITQESDGTTLNGGEFTLDGIEDTLVTGTAVIKDFEKTPNIVHYYFKDKLQVPQIVTENYDDDVNVLVTFNDDVTLIDETVSYWQIKREYDLSDYFEKANIHLNFPTPALRVGAVYTDEVCKDFAIPDLSFNETIEVPVIKPEYSASTIYFWYSGIPLNTEDAVHSVVYTGDSITVDYDFNYYASDVYIDYEVSVKDKETGEHIKNVYLEIKRTDDSVSKVVTKDVGITLPRVRPGDMFRLFGGTDYDWIVIKEAGEYVYEVNLDDVEVLEEHDETTPPEKTEPPVVLPETNITFPEYQDPAKQFKEFPLELITVSAKKIARAIAGFKTVQPKIKYHTLEENLFFAITPIYIEKEIPEVTLNDFPNIEDLKQACIRSHDMKERIPVTVQQIKTIGQKMNRIKDSVILEIANDNINNKLTPEFKKGLDELRQQKNTDNAKAVLRWFMMADKFSQVVNHNFSDYPDTSNDGTVFERFDDTLTMNQFIDDYIVGKDTGWKKLLKTQYWLFNHNFYSPGIYSLRNEFGVDYKIAGFLSENYFNWQARKTKIPIDLCDFFLDKDTNMFVLTNRVLRNKADSAYKKVSTYFNKKKNNSVISYSDYNQLGEEKAMKLLYDISRYFASAFGYNSVCKANSQDMQTMLSEAAKIKNERLSNL